MDYVKHSWLHWLTEPNFCFRSIAKNYSHIKNVEVQLAQLQLQLNLTSGPKKSALEMLRKKIEAKNEQVVTARQKFLSAQKVQKLSVFSSIAFTA